jgi:thiol-disulfide isomerase/thioredoxin
MKNRILILLSVAMLFACTPKDYKLTGNIQGDGLEGVSIFLKERSGREWIDVDSTKVKDFQFVFNGVCDSSRIMYLSFDANNGRRFIQPFVCENGKINVEIDSLYTIIFKGTPQNQLLSDYYAEKKGFYELVNEYYNNNKDVEMPEQKEIFEAKMEEYRTQNLKTDIDFSISNANTVAGTFVFLSSYYEMDIDQKESVLVLMNEQTKTNEQISKIIADIAKEKLTAKGQKFTDIKLPSLTSDSLSLSSFVGKSDYILIDFWASWCGPCLRSFPELTTLYETYKGERFQIFAVSLDNENDKWQDAVKNYKLNWIHVSDLKGWKSEGAALYAVNSIPATVLIDKNGIIVGRNMQLSEIKKLLSEIQGN